MLWARRRQQGLKHIGYVKSMRSAAAVVLNGDLAVYPTQPTSPHMFTVRLQTPLTKPGQNAAHCETGSTSLKCCAGKLQVGTELTASTAAKPAFLSQSHVAQ